MTLHLAMAAAARAGASIPETGHTGRDIATMRDQAETETRDFAARLARPLRLADCIEIALERNLPLLAARQGLDAAEARAGGAIGEFLPEFAAGGRRTRIETAGARVVHDDATAGIVQRLPLGTVIEAGLRVTDSNDDALQGEAAPSVTLVQPLLRGGGWTRATSGLRDARLASRVEEAGLREQVLALVFQVRATYLDVLRRQHLIEVNQRAVARDKELLAYSKAKLEAQLATQRDVLSAEIVLAQDRGRLVNAEAAYRAGLDQLTEVLGLRIGRPLEIEPQELGGAEVEIDAEGWIATALRQNPTVQRAHLECERADLARRVAGNERLPQLDLSVGYNQRRLPLGNDPFERTWEGAVAVSYPFLDKERRGAHTAARLEYEQSMNAAIEAERAVVLNVRDSVRNLQRGQERIDILVKNIEGAQAKVDFARVNFQLGRASNLDITDAQKDLLDAETEHVNELVVYRVELARLEQLLGKDIHDSFGQSSPSPR